MKSALRLFSTPCAARTTVRSFATDRSKEAALVEETFTLFSLEKSAIKPPVLIPTDAGYFAGKVYSVAVEKKQNLAEVQKELRRLVKEYDSREDVKSILAMQMESPNRRLMAAYALGQKLGFSDSVSQFLAFVTKENASATLPKIADAFDEILMAHNKESRATIVVAKTASREAVAEVEKLVQETFPEYKKIHFTVRVDPTIVGGFIVEGEGFTIDRSKATMINKFKKALSVSA